MSVQSPAYVFFRHARRTGLWCAVPKGDALPPPLLDEVWESHDLPTGSHSKPPGFDEDAALYSCHLQGFYVFHWGGRDVVRSMFRMLENAAA